jgi:hypothetical protein
MDTRETNGVFFSSLLQICIWHITLHYKIRMQTKMRKSHLINWGNLERIGFSINHTKFITFAQIEFYINFATFILYYLYP